MQIKKKYPGDHQGIKAELKHFNKDAHLWFLFLIKFKCKSIFRKKIEIIYKVRNTFFRINFQL